MHSAATYRQLDVMSLPQMAVAHDYLNFNGRMEYHYAMVDAFVGPGDQHNYVHLRLVGGGAAEDKRGLRARFVERVLREGRFGVDRRGDLVIAWLRRYARPECERALQMLGRLMVCARQLDLRMAGDADVRTFADRFLAGDYRAFA